ncbi:MAG: hypothetical protein H7235_02870 [Bdellovibrionaceae bacterium]|nr:hypothetical protein [Pseudobdellovibrionaceae bacterium]
MKQVVTFDKKWILTASLIAVLGTQYSYQSSSQDFKSASSIKNYGEFVLASTSSPDNTKAAVDPNDKKTTEAVNPTECKDCKTFVLSPTTTLKLSLEDYTKLITQIKLDIAPATTSTPAAPVAKVNDSDCEPARADETRTERRERIQCEKDERALAKLDKENDKKQARAEKFEDKMEALKEKCADDLECLSSGFTTALSRYEGKDALPAAVVAKAFNSTVGASLKKALASNDPAVLVNAQSLLQDMPEQYKGLKQAVILGVKAQTTVSANKVSTEYAAANELAKQGNKPQEYFEALATAQQDHQALNSLVVGYSASMEQSLELAGDATTIAFYQKSYVPDMKKIMAAVSTGIPNNTTTLDPKYNTRDARNGTTINNGTASTTLPANEKMTRDQNNGQWSVPNSTGGLQIGSPQPNSRGGRGPVNQ